MINPRGRLMSKHPRQGGTTEASPRAHAEEAQCGRKIPRRMPSPISAA
jgi:hypothetical protein